MVLGNAMKALVITSLALAALAPITSLRAEQINGWVSKFVGAPNGCWRLDDPHNFIDAPYDGYLFGKLPESWTSQDVSEMREQIRFCQDYAQRTSNMPQLIKAIRETGDAIISKVPKIVVAARQAKASQDADRASRVAADDQAASKMLRDQEEKEADANRKQAEGERITAEAQLKDSETKNQAIIAAAHARRDAAMARQKAAALEQDAKAAQAEADAAEKGAASAPITQAKNNPAPKQPQSEPSGTPTFSFSSDEFRTLYHKQLIKDGSAGLSSCSLNSNIYVCRFNEKDFKEAVSALKQLDLINGRFTQKTIVQVLISNGKAAGVILKGDRSDPANLFQFMGKAVSLAQALDSTLGDDDAAALTRELGLMRGDDDSTIGEEKTVIRPAFAASCNQFASSESTALRCEFAPRS